MNKNYNWFFLGQQSGNGIAAAVFYVFHQANTLVGIAAILSLLVCV